MKTKKIVLTSIIFIVLTGVFNMLCFVCENERNDNFIISLIFGNFAVIAYAIATLLLFKKDKYKYINFQNVFIVFGYYILSTVMNLLFVLCKLNNQTVNLVVNILLLAAYLVFLLVVLLGNTVSTVDLEKDSQNREEYYRIKEKAEDLLGKGKNNVINKKIEHLYDEICSSQINGTSSVSDVDDKLYETLVEISYLLKAGTEYELFEQISLAMDLLDRRNKRIKNSLN